MDVPTASILVVGDEVLAGHTKDTNSHWVATRLHARGVRLRRVEVVPDEVPVIVEAIRRHVAASPAFVFVMGGLGPTPDDRTYEAVGQALDRPLVVRPEHAAWLRDRVQARGLAGEAWADVERSEGMRRMVRLPEGSHALDNPVGAALGCVADAGAARVVVLPGVPRELYAMFEQSFEPRFLADVAATEVTQELEAFGAEAELWDLLSACASEEPGVRIGSYPQDHRGRLILRVAGPASDVARVVERLTAATRSLRSARIYAADSESTPKSAKEKPRRSAGPGRGRALP